MSLLAIAPALPLHTAGKYVAAAYVVFLAIVLVYVAIMANRLRHTERDLVELRRDLEDQRPERDEEDSEVQRVA
jgi:cell division protein FtsL